jgi:hypothetical protein
MIINKTLISRSWLSFARYTIDSYVVIIGVKDYLVNRPMIKSLIQKNEVYSVQSGWSNLLDINSFDSSNTELVDKVIECSNNIICLTILFCFIGISNKNYLSLIIHHAY